LFKGNIYALKNLLKCLIALKLYFLYGLTIGSCLAKLTLNLATLEKFAHIALKEFEILDLPKKFTWQL
jgi:hypothetical protein